MSIAYVINKYCSCCGVRIANIDMAIEGADGGTLSYNCWHKLLAKREMLLSAKV